MDKTEDIVQVVRLSDVHCILVSWSLMYVVFSFTHYAVTYIKPHLYGECAAVMTINIANGETLRVRDQELCYNTLHGCWALSSQCTSKW